MNPKFISRWLLVAAVSGLVCWECAGTVESNVCLYGDCKDFPPCETCPCPPGAGGPGAAGAGGGAGGGCIGCFGVSGMPVWRVSEPYINLWIEDEPLGYQPGRGPRVSFRLSYKLREANAGSDPTTFSVGNKWNFSWLSYVVPDSSQPSTTARVYYPGGGDIQMQVGVPAYLNNVRLDRETSGGNLVAYHLVQPDGSTNTYGFLLTNGSGAVLKAFLTRKRDPAGQSTRFDYEPFDPSAPVARLKYVVDADDRTNTIHYVTSHPSNTNLIDHVVDPFNRAAWLAYDAQGQLTNIVDVANLTSSIAYDNVGGATNMTTPYGTTSFKLTEPAIGMSGRAIEVSLPDGGKQLYLYRDGLSSILPYSYTDETPDTSPFGNTFDNTSMYDRNSFHWNPKQYDALSTTDLNNLTSADYRLATMKHWLQAGPAEPGKTLSMQRESSPDDATEGQKTWYDYAGKPATHLEGTQIMPLFTARVLPNGQSWFVRTEPNEWGLTATNISTYATGASVGLRTNIYLFAGSGIDLVSHFGPEGHTEAGYFYNENHQVLRRTNALNEVTFYTYNANGQVTSVKTPAGLVTTNIYFTTGDYSNWLDKTIALEINRTNAYTYTNGLVHTHTDERGLTITNTWDALQRLRRVDFPDGTFITNSYDKLDLVRALDRMGFTNSFGYDSMRRRTAETNALGHFTLYNYCNCDSLDSIRDAAGNFTYFNYDLAGRLTNTVYADGYSVINTYNPLGQLVRATDSAGSATTNWYNNQGLLEAVSNAVGRVQTITYDMEDRATNTVDANGVSIQTTYDLLGRIRTRTYPDTGVERFGYSARGLVAYTNQLNQTNFYAYDAARRKTFETNANQEVTQFRYDQSGNLTNLIDGKNQNTFWKYDLFGRVTNKVDHLGTNLFAYKYDPNDQLTNRWSPAKGDTKYSYDPAGNLTNIDYAVSPDINLSYDALNRLTNMVDAVGSTAYSWSAAGQLLSEDGPWANDTVSRTYDNRLRTGLSLLQPNASDWVQSYAYDAARRLTNVTSLAGAFTYVYSATKKQLPVTIYLPNTAYIENSYNSVARQTVTRLRDSSNEILNQHVYAYNLAGQRTNQTRINDDYVSYTYDAIGQLRTAVGKEAGGATSRLNEQFGYAYDAAGNLNHRTNNALVQSFAVNSLNELSEVTRSGTLTVAGTTTSAATNVTVNNLTASRYADATFAKDGFPLVNGTTNFTAIAQDSYGRTDTNAATVDLSATHVFAYDLNGNLRTNGTRILEYDDENQLTRITEPGKWKSEFVYDGKLRRRLRKEFTWLGSAWVQTDEVRYVYDGNLVVQERDANNLPLVSYTRGRDLSGSLEGAGGIGGLLARTDNATGDSAFYHADSNGNITALINAKQLLLAKYLYDPFGNTLSLSGPLAEANLYRFSSKELHPNSGLVYYLYRYYEPSLQRWPNRDPIGEDGGINLFRFAGNNPVTDFDPWGLRLPSFGPPRTAGGGFPAGDWRLVSVIIYNDCRGNCAVKTCVYERHSAGADDRIPDIEVYSKDIACDAICGLPGKSVSPNRPSRPFQPDEKRR